MRREDIPIPVPCREDWDTMKVGEKTLFCTVCTRHVIDLARATEAEARAILERRGDACARFALNARGEVVFREERLVPVSRLSRAKGVFALGAAVVGVSALAACTPPPPVEYYGGVMACPPRDAAADPSTIQVEPFPPSTDDPAAPAVDAGAKAPIERK